MNEDIIKMPIEPPTLTFKVSKGWLEKMKTWKNFDIRMGIKNFVKKGQIIKYIENGTNDELLVTVTEIIFSDDVPVEWGWANFEPPFTVIVFSTNPKIMDNDFERLAKLNSEVNINNGFKWEKEVWASKNVSEALMNIVTEVAEAQQESRKNNFTKFQEEIADIIIRCLDLTNALEIDIMFEIEKKIESNKKRSYRHDWKRS